MRSTWTRSSREAVSIARPQVRTDQRPRLLARRQRPRAADHGPSAPPNPRTRPARPRTAWSSTPCDQPRTADLAENRSATSTTRYSPSTTVQYACPPGNTIRNERNATSGSDATAPEGLTPLTTATVGASRTSRTPPRAKSRALVRLHLAPPGLASASPAQPTPTAPRHVGDSGHRSVTERGQQAVRGDSR